MKSKLNAMFEDLPSAIKYMQKSKLRKNKLFLSLIRHAECSSNVKDVFQSTKDKNDSLTVEGIKQADLLKAFVCVLPVDFVFSSDFERAMETAKILFENKKTISNAGFRELDFGNLAGFSHEGLDSDLAIKYPKLYTAFQNNVENFNPPNGERFKEFQAGVKKKLEKIITKYEGKSVCVISHYWWIREAIRNLTGFKKTQEIPPIRKTSLTIFEINRGKPKLLLFNNFDHLFTQWLLYAFENLQNPRSLKFMGEKNQTNMLSLKNKESIKLCWNDGLAFTKDFPSFMVVEACKEVPKRFSAISLFAELGLDAILLLRHNPSKVIALDISKRQVQLIKTNIFLNSENWENAEIAQSNLFQKLPKNTKVDLITANPPQTPNSEVFEKGHLSNGKIGPFEPDGDGLGFFRRIFKEAQQFLKPDGIVVLSFQDFLGTANLQKLAEKNNLTIEKIIDFPGRSQVYAGGKTYKNLEFIEELTGYRFFKTSNKKDSEKFKDWHQAKQNIKTGVWYQKRLLKVRKG